MMINFLKNKPRGVFIGGVLCGIAIGVAIDTMRSRNMTAAENENIAETTGGETSPRIAGATPEEAGRYLVLVAGCNDCHTPGFMQQGLSIPESQWLTGLPIGFRGPWGTSYGSNLRLFARDFDEDMWTAVLRARMSRPPMPWSTLHSMSDADLRAVYRYIRSLEVKGDPMPAFVPPSEEPKTPYFVMVPQAPAEEAPERR